MSVRDVKWIRPPNKTGFGTGLWTGYKSQRPWKSHRHLHWCGWRFLLPPPPLGAQPSSCPESKPHINLSPVSYEHPFRRAERNQAEAEERLVAPSTRCEYKWRRHSTLLITANYLPILASQHLTLNDYVIGITLLLFIKYEGEKKICQGSIFWCLWNLMGYLSWD